MAVGLLARASRSARRAARGSRRCRRSAASIASRSRSTSSRSLPSLASSKSGRGVAAGDAREIEAGSDTSTLPLLVPRSAAARTALSPAATPPSDPGEIAAVSAEFAGAVAEASVAAQRGCGAASQVGRFGGTDATRRRAAAPATGSAPVAPAGRAPFEHVGSAAAPPSARPPPAGAGDLLGRLDHQHAARGADGRCRPMRSQKSGRLQPEAARATAARRARQRGRSVAKRWRRSSASSWPSE